MTKERNQGNVVKSPGSESTAVEKERAVKIPSSISVKQLADLLQVSAIDVIKQLMKNGVMANITQVIDYQTASRVAETYNYEVGPEPKVIGKKSSLVRDIKKQQRRQGKNIEGRKSRPPIITVMGHVDHGKTKLLDAIRKTNVADSESGGITQHIGAYQVEIEGHKITFLDTPGHEAFTAMRARGAEVTDIAVLVVAADDGVMPQTVEAIDHARVADVPIVVALNKIDRPEANPDHVKQQLTDAGLLIEEWGGDVVCILVSAKEGTGISDLLENLLVVAEMEELEADPSQPATGVVIEAKMDRTKGPLATVLVLNGTLRVGDTVVVGETWGKLKALYNDEGKQLRKAGPAAPVEILGLSSIPEVGDTLNSVGNEKKAKFLVKQRQSDKEQKAASTQAVSLVNIFDQVSSGEIKELNIVIRADVQGSLEPIISSLEQLTTDKIKVNIIHSGSGNITASDITLAIAASGIIIGFNTDAEPGARRLAKIEGISIRSYDVIYNLVDDIKMALAGMLEPQKVEVLEGRAEVRAVFSAIKKLRAAGVYVNEGKVSRGSLVRVLRKDKVVNESSVASLRRFTEDVREVSAGYECGVVVKDFNSFEEGDILEFFRIEENA